MIADEAIRLVEFIRENDEDRYEYLSSSIEELASGISDMKRMLELVLDELRKQGILADRIRKIADKSLQRGYFVRNCKRSE